MDHPRIVGSLIGQARTPRREAFAWAQIASSSSALTIVDSEGIAGATWNSTGNWSIDFLVPRPNQNYAVIINAKSSSTAAQQMWNHPQTIATSGVRVNFLNHLLSTGHDPDLATIVCIGNNF